MKIVVKRVSGATEEMEIPRPGAISYITRMLGADRLDTVNLRDGRVMLVDDTGMVDGKPVNPAATALYHSVCRPGTVWAIHGDVVIATDADFAS